MKLYISGGMTFRADTDHNFPAFDAAAAELIRCGYEISNPADRGVIEGWSWEDYLRVDLKDLLECDGVATLESWVFSRGAKLEIDVAKRLAMPVYSVEQWVGLHALSLNVI